MNSLIERVEIYPEGQSDKRNVSVNPARVKKNHPQYRTRSAFRGSMLQVMVIFS